MSSKNSEADGMAFVLAFLGAGFIILGMFIFAVALVFAIVLTIVAIFAWDKPLTLLGETVQPHEARWFVYRGIIGTCVLPAFVAFCQALYGFHVDDAVWQWLFLGGYVAGSVGIEALIAMNEEESASRTPPSYSQPVQKLTPNDNDRVITMSPREALAGSKRSGHIVPAQVPPPLPQAPQKETGPFRYASWDDEEARQ